MSVNQIANTPISQKLLEFSNKMLVIFNLIVHRFNMTEWVFGKIPLLRNSMSYEALTLTLTVIVGLLIITTFYVTLINISKFTLNFMIFMKWATAGVLLLGTAYNIFTA